MNFLKKLYLLLLILFPLHLLGMETNQITNLDGIPLEVKVIILDKLIESTQTLPECKEIFKALIMINKDLDPIKKDHYKIQPFRSTLFKKLELKKYKILCAIDQKVNQALEELKRNKLDIVNKGLNTTYVTGWTALHSAAREGNAEIAALLIKNGANINIKDSRAKFTPLQLAISFRHNQVAELFIDNDANVNDIGYEQKSALHYATANSSSSLVALLILKGAYINAQDIDQRTPLHKAILWGNKSIVKLLIEQHADLTIKDKYSLTPLELAKRWSSSDSKSIIALLEAANKKS